MQAIERIEISNNWLTLLFIGGMFLLVVLKMLNGHKLYEYSRAFFLKGFIEKKVEERISFFTGFNLFLYLFSILIFALFFSYVTAFFAPEIQLNLQLYFKVFVFVFGYFSVFMLLDIVLCHLLEIKGELAYIIEAKLGYSYNIALFLFPFLILATYSFLSMYAVMAVFIILLMLSVILTFINNKNLIINKLFYFILYLCALEIAPLLIIYKITV